MTAKEFLKSKGFDDLREGLYHVFEQDEIELLLNEFAALPCSCEGGQAEKATRSALPPKVEMILVVVAKRWGKEYGGSTVGILGQDAIEICEKYGIDWENYR